MEFTRRLTAGLGLLAAAGALRSAPAGAQSGGQAFPSRPITLVVAWAPGGSTDFVARVLAQQLTKELGQQVVVENRPGASGTIGHASVARARPDGAASPASARWRPRRSSSAPTTISACAMSRASWRWPSSARAR